MTLKAEIEEQPAALRRLLESNRPVVREIARHIAAVAPTVVLIAARGTSDNAARYAQYVWGARNGFTVALAATSLFSLYRMPPRLDGALVVGLSQSGESPDLVAVLEEARAQGRPTLTITNVSGSPLARAADLVIELCAGDETAVAATKTYTTQLGAVALLSAALDGDAGSLDGVADDMNAVLQRETEIAAAAAGFADMDAAVVLGRGFNYATTFEWALKLEELAHVVAHPFSTADFIHGPLALAGPRSSVLAVVPRGVSLPGEAALLRRLEQQIGARVAVISNDAAVLNAAGVAMPIPDCPEWLSPLPAVVAAQLFTYHLALARGLDPDTPPNIEKVTRTL